MASVIPLNGEVTSWTNNTGLISGAVKPSQIVWNIAADEGDVTAFESNTLAAEYISGLRNGTGTITSFLSPATYGLQGLVTSASSANYTTNSKSWNMTIAIDESDTTAFGATGVADRLFAPGMYRWNGQFVCNTDDTTAITLPGQAKETLTLKYLDAGGAGDDVDFALSGSAFVLNLGSTSTPNAVAETTFAYRGSGQLSSAGGDGVRTPIFPVGASSVAAAISGFQAGALTTVLTSGTTIAANAFPTSIQITVDPNSPIQVVTNFRASGAFTIS
jgi:hypothetical protein